MMRRRIIPACATSEELPPEDDQQRTHDKGNAEGEHHRDEVAVDDALALARTVILAHEGRAGGVNGSHHVIDERVGVRGGGVAFHHHLIKGVHARLNEQVRYCENRVLQTGGNAQRQHLLCLVRLNPQHRPFQPHHAP